MVFHDLGKRRIKPYIWMLWVGSLILLASLTSCTELIDEIGSILSGEKDVKRTQTTLAALKAASELFMAENSGECPTCEDLVKEKLLHPKWKRDASGNAVDEWGNPIEIRCEKDRITVISPGPDGKKGTKDDLWHGDK